VAVRYEFFGKQNPEFLLSVGEALFFSGQEVLQPIPFTAWLEKILTLELDRLREDASALRLDDFVTIIKGKGSRGSLFIRFTWLIRSLIGSND
jgi:hypothetical protein